MILDLAEQPVAHRILSTDVLIVGGGTAGLMLADRLRRRHVRVAILESGGREQLEPIHPLNKVVQLGHNYAGATEGRFRCLGGTSTRWGGALLPFLASDVGPRPYLGLTGFPVEIHELTPFLDEIEKLFAIDSGSYEEDLVEQIRATRHVPTGDAEFQIRFAKWPPFKNRNVALLLDRTLKQDPDLEVSLNSTVTAFELIGGRVSAVTAQHESGRTVTVTPKRVVICAGAIETTRLLLLLDRQHDNSVFEQSNALGRYFYDHISLPLAEIETPHPKALNRMAGFRFMGSTMRSLRFELSPFAQSRERVGSAFGHISFRTTAETGFDALRKLMRAQQSTGRIELNRLLAVAGELPYFAQLGYWRAVHRQLLWPRPATYELHVVAEQLPNPTNRITLSSKSDMFGQPVAAIDWRVTEEDRKIFGVYRRLFDQFWARQGLARVGTLKWLDDGVLLGSQTDVFHPGGSTRLGIDPRSAVLDPNLKVFGLANLWAASTAAFPSGGGANPTLMLLLFTMRLADHLAEQSQ